MDYVIIICIAAMAAIFVMTVYNIITLGRAARIEYIRDFKKGRFVYIYVVALPLLYLALSFNGLSFLDALMESIKKAMDLIFLEFNFDITRPLMQHNDLFMVAMISCYIFVALNTLMFVFALFGYKIINYFIVRFTCRFAKAVNVIIGYNAQNIQLISTIDRRKNGRSLLICQSQNDFDDSISTVTCGRIKLPFEGNLIEQILGKIKNISRRRVNIFINTNDDKLNIIFTKQAAAFFAANNLKASAFNKDAGFNVYAFGNPENENAFIHFVEKTTGAIRYINKYKLMAFDFCMQYPLTKFMTSEQIDFGTALIKNDAEINTFFIGFGQTNQQLFLTFIANNQFLTGTKDGINALPVNYYIFDKEDSTNDKNLNHNYFRYQSEKEQFDPQNYLPLPPEPAAVTFIKQDINGGGFYSNLQKAVTDKSGKKSYSYVVIAFGSDMENIDLAKKLIDKFKEWGISRIRIFVKVRDSRLIEEVVSCELFPCDSIIPFGCEWSVYNYEKISHSDIEFMARLRHLTYAIEYQGLHSEDADKLDVEEIKEKTRYEWFTRWSQVQRDSNIYACMSLRLKLHLTGYDYLPSGQSQSLSADFMQKYTQGHPINYYQKAVCGKKAVRYNNEDFEVPSLRRTYAMLEHQRWNAYMIASGFIPSSIAEISAPDRGKLYGIRKHGNITTFEGLKQYRKIVAQSSGKTEEQTDVIRYDYQLMDDAVWLLDSCGYQIVKKA